MTKMFSKTKATSHQRLQHYEHHYGMVCLTGLLGCRWHRYQQSQDASSKCDVGWYITLLVSTAFVLMWFYFWLLADNSSDDINSFIYSHFGTWKYYYSMFFILTCTTITYAGVLNILALCHVGHHHQVHIHWTHKVTIILIIVCCVTAVIAISELWPIGWKLQASSLMITSPFLHLAAVTLMTILTWFIAAKWLTLYRIVSRILFLGLYIALMLFLYLVPLLIKSPCIVEDNELPPKPSLVAHRGLPALRPENTVVSFQEGHDYVTTYETDVRVSYDGIAFLMHDDNLRRTTDVEEQYPEYASYNPCWFNISEIDTLDAGSWYLETDPFKEVSSLSKADRAECVNQSVPRLSWLLKEADSVNRSVMMDIQGCGDAHPFVPHEVILETINKSGINPKQVWWLTGLPTDPELHNISLVYQVGLSQPPPPPLTLVEAGIDGVNAEFGLLSIDDVRAYQEAGIWVNVYIIDSHWLYSLYWCMGVDYVATNHAKHLSELDKPVWLLTPKQFNAMWITTDVVSLALVVLIFIIQHLRRYSKVLEKSIHSERLSLQGAKIRMSHLRKNRNMKEKLLHTVEGLQEVDPGFLGMSSDNLAVTGESVENTGNCNGTSTDSKTDPTPLDVSRLTPSRMSTWSTTSGNSGISAISGSGVGDANFTTAPPSDGDSRPCSLSTLDSSMVEVTLEVPS